MEETRYSNKWLTLLVASLSGFVVTLDMGIVNIAFPELTRVFNTDATVVLWVTVAYVLVSAGLTPVFGRLGDMIGRKKIFVTGLIIFTIGLVGCSISQSISQLIAARAVQGIGSAMIMALALAIVTDAFPENARGKALGVTGSIFSIGPILGPAVGGVLVDILSWRAIFYLQIPISIISLIMAVIFLKEWRDPNRESKLDLWGAGSIFISLSCFTLFFNLGEQYGFLSPLALGLLAAGIITLILFIIQEKRVAQPVINLNLFKNISFTTGNITLFLLGLAGAAHMFLTPFYLIDGVGYTASMSGLFLAMVPVLGIALGPISGAISDKIGYRLLSTMGTALVCLSLFLFSRLDVASGTGEIIILLSIFGLGSGIFMTPNQSQIMGALPKDALGVGSATINTVRQVAASSGTAIVGAIYASRLAFHYAELTVTNPEASGLEQLALIGGYQDAMLFTAILCAIGIVTSAWRNTRKQGLAPAAPPITE